MHVFLSYSHADKGLAAKLRQSLEAKGLSFNDPGESPVNGSSWRQQVEKAIQGADAILLLLSSRKKADEQQQLTWRLALQNVWENPAKPWIPLLLGDAKLPAFVRSGASGDKVEAIRIRDPKNLGPASEAILRSLIPSSTKRSRRGWDWDDRESSATAQVPVGSSPAKSFGERFVLDLVETYPKVTDEDRIQRQENLSAIRRYAEQLKH